MSRAWKRARAPTRWRWKPICAGRWRRADRDFLPAHHAAGRRRGGGLRGAAALASSRTGLIAPADFIAHSEETGLIVALGRFALEQAAQRSVPLAALFSADAALVRQRQSFPPAIARPRLRGSCWRRVHESQPDRARHAEAGNHRKRGRQPTPNSPPMLSAPQGAGRRAGDRRFRHRRLHPQPVPRLPFDTVKIDKSFLARHAGMKPPPMPGSGAALHRRPGA